MGVSLIFNYEYSFLKYKHRLLYLTVTETGEKSVSHNNTRTCIATYVAFLL